jgi:hypothetical protein
MELAALGFLAYLVFTGALLYWAWRDWTRNRRARRTHANFVRALLNVVVNEPDEDERLRRVEDHYELYSRDMRALKASPTRLHSQLRRLVFNLDAYDEQESVEAYGVAVPEDGKAALRQLATRLERAELDRRRTVRSQSGGEAPVGPRPSPSEPPKHAELDEALDSLKLRVEGQDEEFRSEQDWQRRQLRVMWAAVGATILVGILSAVVTLIDSS